MRRALKDLKTNITAGIGLALFRRRALSDFRISVEQLIWLVFAGLLVDFSRDYTFSLPNPSFNLSAFPYSSFSVLLFMLAAYLYARVLHRREAAIELLVVVCSANFIFYFLQWAMLALPGHTSHLPGWFFQAATIVYVVWVITALLRALSLVAERRKGLVVVGLIMLMLIWVVPATWMGRGERFWYHDYRSDRGEDRYSAYRNMDGESLMYAQDKMLQHELAGLKPGRPGVTDLYFIGFAGYARQDVFAKEVSYARNVMDKRYGTEGRSLLFINNLKSRNDYPLASATNLRRALKAVASKMNDEDVLMLYLTSHGSRKHELAVDFWPLPLNDITPKELRAMLDEAGIRWRVVVVSACYSGGFVEPLKEAHTFIATAAASDRTSFGCSNDRDFTYYGEALFKNELLHSDSMLTALRQAPLDISRRERKEKLEPSRPQLYSTPQVEKKLQGITKLECTKDSAADKALSC